MDEGQVVGFLLIDLSKAFNTVPHVQLIRDLHEIGCGQMVCDMVPQVSREEGTESLLSSCDYKRTGSDGVEEGFPWGAPGLLPIPVAVNVYVRDRPAASASLTVQFADYLTQSEADKDVDKVLRKLTESFMNTKAYCDQRELIINAIKTQLILFKSPRRKLLHNLKIELDGVSIEPVSNVKLLGFYLDQHFTYGSTWTR